MIMEGLIVIAALIGVFRQSQKYNNNKRNELYGE